MIEILLHVLLATMVTGLAAMGLLLASIGFLGGLYCLFHPKKPVELLGIMLANLVVLPGSIVIGWFCVQAVVRAWGLV